MRRAKSIGAVCGASRVREYRRSLRRGLTRVSWIGVLTASVCTAVPAVSGAALSDGRVYEQVSPANKNGNSAGINLINGGDPNNRDPLYAFGTANGDGILFGGDGPMGESVSSGIDHFFIARRNSSGWHTISAIPRDADNAAHVPLGWPLMVDPSPDLTQLAFIAQVPFAPPPDAGSPATNQIFIANNSGPELTLSWPGAPGYTRRYHGNQRVSSADRGSRPELQHAVLHVPGHPAPRRRLPRS